MPRSLVLVLLAALAALLCTACARKDDVRQLTAWTLVAPSGARRAVTLPATFAAGDLDADSTAVLEAEVDVPTGWEDGPVTLALASFGGRATLDVEGRTVPAREIALAHSWQLGETVRGARRAALRLRLRSDLKPGLMVVPTLSATPDGDEAFLGVSGFNLVSSVAGTATCGFVAVVYLALYLLDRRRALHGYVALQAGLSAPIAAYPLWSGRAGGWTFVLIDLMAAITVPAAAGFARAYFRWPRHPLAVRVGLAGIAASALLAIPPTTRLVALDVGAAFVTTALAGLTVGLVRETRAGSDRFAPAAFAVGWLLLILLYLPDVQALTVGGPAIAGGCVGIPAGLAVYALVQVVVLGRDHLRSLREAEGRVKELEVRGREVDALNEELRHQVAERSRELTEALARAEGTVAPASLEAGHVFDGRYRVRRELGRGGMGAVYEVERASDARRLALKVITGRVPARAAARFAREAEIGARVRHDNLVSIVDVGIAAGGTPFLVMELVEGGTLEARRARFGDVAWASPLLRQIAAGLAELHAHRIVHRDLKPGNVLLAAVGAPGELVAKISDFGISRFGALDEGEAEAEASDRTVTVTPPDASPRALTQTGALMGTPLYMPPEARLGPAKHPSADVFSLGVLAYELLTGRAPFADALVFQPQSRDPAPPPPSPAGVQPAVAELVLACLRADPSQRPRARDVADALPS